MLSRWIRRCEIFTVEKWSFSLVALDFWVNYTWRSCCGECVALRIGDADRIESHNGISRIRRCEVKTLYLLARPKKGKSSFERMSETFTGALFTVLAKQQPDYMQRIQVIDGDTRDLDVGLSNEAQAELCENVDIILHAAADVRFDSTLMELCLVNLRGTRELLRLAERCKKLQMFAYISTAFSHCVRKCVEEKFYDVPISPHEMIRIAEHFEGRDDADLLNVLTDRFVSPWPNTYTFSKALSEQLIREYGNRVPAVIIRPSISEYFERKFAIFLPVRLSSNFVFVHFTCTVISTHEDPIPAWCNVGYFIFLLCRHVHLYMLFEKLCVFDDCCTFYLSFTLRK